MIFSARRAALVLIPLLAGFGLLALAWSQLFGPNPVPLPPPFLSTQANQPPLPNLLPVAVSTEALIITIASQPYRHPSGAFAINYPDGWQIDEAEDSVQFTSPDEQAAQFSVTFASSEAVSDGDFERDLRQTWGDLPDFTIQTPDSSQLPERWSAAFTFTQTLPPNRTEIPMQGISMYWQQAKVRYNFVALVTTEAWGRVESVIQSIANSLQTYPNAATNESE